jgi:hypothetical protein
MAHTLARAQRMAHAGRSNDDVTALQAALCEKTRCGRDFGTMRRVAARWSQAPLEVTSSSSSRIGPGGVPTAVRPNPPIELKQSTPIEVP